MIPQEARSQLAEVERQQQRQETYRADLVAQHDAAVRRPPHLFDPSEVAGFTRAIADVDTRLQALDDRRTVLELALPNEMQLAKMREEAERIVDSWREDAPAMTSTIAAFFRALEAVETTARQLVAQRVRARQQLGRLTQMNAAGDLRLTVPRLVDLTPEQQQVAVWLAALVKEAACGDISDVVDNNLRALRQPVSA